MRVAESCQLTLISDSERCIAIFSPSRYQLQIIKYLAFSGCGGVSGATDSKWWRS